MSKDGGKSGTERVERGEWLCAKNSASLRSGSGRELLQLLVIVSPCVGRSSQPLNQPAKRVFAVKTGSSYTGVYTRCASHSLHTSSLAQTSTLLYRPFAPEYDTMLDEALPSELFSLVHVNKRPLTDHSILSQARGGQNQAS